MHGMEYFESNDNNFTYTCFTCVDMMQFENISTWQDVCVRERESVCVCVCERERVREREKERESVCV
jgi:hypothetical protein